MQKIFLTAAVIFALASPVFVPAYAQTCPPGKSGLQCAGTVLGQVANPSQTGLSGDLATTVATVIKAILALVGTIFLVLTIYAGILWMTAQGEEEKVTKAKDIIKASIIGLVIIMSAYAITYFVTSKLGGATTSNQPGPTTVCNIHSNVTTCGADSQCFWLANDPANPSSGGACINAP